jgi:hypothetical protein
MKKIFPKTKFDRETDFKLLLDQKFHDTASASNSNLPRDKLIRIFKSLNHENAQSLLETAEELLHSQLTDGQDSDGEETENHDNQDQTEEEPEDKETEDQDDLDQTEKEPEDKETEDQDDQDQTEKEPDDEETKNDQDQPEEQPNEEEAEDQTDKGKAEQLKLTKKRKAEAVQTSVTTRSKPKHVSEEKKWNE